MAGNHVTAVITVRVTYDPVSIRLSQLSGDDRTPIEVVSDEVESNLDSVPYVRRVDVQKIVQCQEVNS